MILDNQGADEALFRQLHNFRKRRPCKQQTGCTFGFRFYENKETGQSYQYLFNIEENRYRFEKSPNMPWPANQNIGLERPIRLETGKKYHIQMILDDTIATIYVDGVALNTRFYQKFGQSLSLFVIDGTLTVTNAGLSKTIK